MPKFTYPETPYQGDDNFFAGVGFAEDNGLFYLCTEDDGYRYLSNDVYTDAYCGLPVPAIYRDAEAALTGLRALWVYSPTEDNGDEMPLSEFRETEAWRAVVALGDRALLDGSADTHREFWASEIGDDDEVEAYYDEEHLRVLSGTFAVHSVV